jgi:hypothetical protein
VMPTSYPVYNPLGAPHYKGILTLIGDCRNDHELRGLAVILDYSPGFKWHVAEHHLRSYNISPTYLEKTAIVIHTGRLISAFIGNPSSFI